MRLRGVGGIGTAAADLLRSLGVNMGIGTGGGRAMVVARWMPAAGGGGGGGGGCVLLDAI